MPNPSQEPPASSKSPDQDLKDMDVLCTFKIKIETQNWVIKDQWPCPNQYQDVKTQSGTSSTLWSMKCLHIQNQDRKLKFGTWVYQIPVTRSKSWSNIKLQSGTYSIPQISKAGLKGYGCSLHLQDQEREPKFGVWVYQRPETISQLSSEYQTIVRNLHHPQKH